MQFPHFSPLSHLKKDIFKRKLSNLQFTRGEKNITEQKDTCKKKKKKESPTKEELKEKILQQNTKIKTFKLHIKIYHKRHKVCNLGL